MESSDSSGTQPSATMERPVFPSVSPKGPAHELRDRAKAAKLRHKAARARVKANQLEGRARHLSQKALDMERRADELDGIVRTPVPATFTE